MKRLILCFLVVFLLIGIQPAYAAGKLSETQENFWVVKDYRTYAYAYAKIENIGDKPIKIHAGILEIFDENGDTITSSDYLNAYAKYLQPDEYTYAYMSTEIQENDPPFIVDDYMLTITGKSDNEKTTIRLPCEVDYQEDVGSGWSTYDYMFATITNNTDEPIYQVYAVFALLDDNDNILYVTTNSLDSNQALMPNSAIRLRCTVDSDNKEAFTSAGYEATHVDAIAYAYIENN